MLNQWDAHGLVKKSINLDKRRNYNFDDLELRVMEDLLPPAGDGGVADHGVATSMQVVVKAANQKYNDQTIECQGNGSMLWFSSVSFA